MQSNGRGCLCTISGNFDRFLWGILRLPYAVVKQGDVLDNPLTQWKNHPNSALARNNTISQHAIVFGNATGINVKHDKSYSRNSGSLSISDKLWPGNRCVRIMNQIFLNIHCLWNWLFFFKIHGSDNCFSGKSLFQFARFHAYNCMTCLCIHRVHIRKTATQDCTCKKLALEGSTQISQ